MSRPLIAHIRRYGLVLSNTHPPNFPDGIQVQGFDLNAWADRIIATEQAIPPLQETVGALAPGAALDISIPASPVEFAFRDTGTTNRYTYTATPTAPATINIADQKSGVTNISISPGGSTAHDLTFNLPATKTIPVFAVAYNKGTHAGALTIGGEVVTGTGALSFVWDEETDGYVLADDTVTLKLEQTAPWDFVEFDAETLGCIPGSGKTFTFALPTTKVADFFFIQYATDSSADGNTLIGDHEIDDGTGVTGIVLCSWNGDEYVVNEITLPDQTPVAILDVEDGNDDNTITIYLPTDPNNVSRSMLLYINSTEDSGSRTEVDIVGVAGAMLNKVEDVPNGGYFLFCSGTIGTNGGTRAVWSVITMPAQTKITLALSDDAEGNAISDIVDALKAARILTADSAVTLT